MGGGNSNGGQYLGDDMRRTDKINIVAPLILQSEHHGGQLIFGHFLTVTLMADFKILAKQAQQVAMGEKNGTGSMSADQRFLLTEMRIAAGHPGLFAGMAGAGFIDQPVDTAFSWTKLAGFEQGIGFFYLSF
jgi:hypothetical protein